MHFGHILLLHGGLLNLPINCIGISVRIGHCLWVEQVLNNLRINVINGIIDGYVRGQVALNHMF